jgi:hypothetical protein
MSLTADGGPPREWVPRGGLLLHVGPHKTGTTALQGAFAARRDDLPAHGVMYAGNTAAPHGAVRARLSTPGGWNDEVPAGSKRMWRRLCAQTSDTPLTVLVSSEALCHATPGQAANLCHELRPERPARVVITVRPLARIVPSSWQEYLKSGWVTSYDEFLQSVLRDRPGVEGPTPTFWLRQDHARLVRWWSKAVGAENVVLMVTDPSRPELIVQTFEQMLSLPRGFVGLEGAPGNRSLTVAESELVRRVNQLVGRSIEWNEYNSVFRQGGLRTLIEERRPPVGAAALGLPEWAAERVREFGGESVTAIRESGVHVMGDLESLGGVPDGVVADVPALSAIGRDAVQVLVDGMFGRLVAPVEVPTVVGDDPIDLDDAARIVHGALLAVVTAARGST